MSFKSIRYPLVQVSILIGSLTTVGVPNLSTAETLQVPWECSTYTGDAQTRCINALLEAQQKKIAELEGKLQAQEGTVSQLKSQLDRQSTAAADLQRQLAERPTNFVRSFASSNRRPFCAGTVSWYDGNGRTIPMAVEADPR